MPLAGVVVPTHDELAADEPGRLPQWVTPEELLHMAQRWDPKESPWTYEMLAATFEDFEERDYTSTTFLLSACLRSAIVERALPYVATAESFYPAVRGTWAHLMLENKARPGALAEARFHTTLNGEAISASPDLITGTDMYDYKFTENPPAYQYPRKGHRRQLELNRYIVNRAHKIEMSGDPDWKPDLAQWRDTKFENLTVVYLGPKGPKLLVVEKSQEWVTPNMRTIKRKMPYVASDEEVEEWAEPLMELVLEAQRAFPEWPEGLENAEIKAMKDWRGRPTRPFQGPPEWRCYGKPFCLLPNCTAQRYPHGLTWENE